MRAIRWLRRKAAAAFLGLSLLVALCGGSLLLCYLRWKKSRDEKKLLRELAPWLAQMPQGAPTQERSCDCSRES